VIKSVLARSCPTPTTTFIKDGLQLWGLRPSWVRQPCQRLRIPPPVWPTKSNYRTKHHYASTILLLSHLLYSRLKQLARHLTTRRHLFP
jgi:hypothetical protein